MQISLILAIFNPGSARPTGVGRAEALCYMLEIALKQLYEMKLEDLGYNDKLEKLRNENNLNDFEIGRVISEHKERYIVKTEKGELEAEITGNLRFTSKGREDFPAVGDWVALTIHDSEFSIIHQQFTNIYNIFRVEQA